MQPGERGSAPSPLRGGFPLFRVRGILVRADPSWLFIFAIVLVSLAIGYFPGTVPGQAPATYWLAASLTTLLFFASLLVHELSHALVAIRAGIEVPRITLFLFGGVSQMQEEPRWLPELARRSAWAWWRSAPSRSSSAASSVDSG